MKVIKKILSLTMLMFLLTSCSTLEKEPVFLFSNGEGRTDIAYEGFSLAQSHGINTHKVEKEYSDMKGKTMNVGEYKGLEYKQTVGFLTSADSEDMGAFYSQFDEYELKDENGRVYAKCLHDTNKIVYYKSSGDMQDDQPAVSIDKLRKIAEDFIISEIGEDLLDKYTFISVDALPTGTAYMAHYQRYVDGYYTDEDIEVYMTPSGNIWSYRFDNIEKYDNVSTKLTKKKLDNAYELLKEKVEGLKLDETEFYSPCLVTDADGKVYLEMKVDYNEGTYTTCSLFYISVD